MCVSANRCSWTEPGPTDEAYVFEKRGCESVYELPLKRSGLANRQA